ncbi:MAG: hypothetical protein ACU85V_04170 [Gammaproteobacteria bacterium]
MARTPIRLCCLVAALWLPSAPAADGTAVDELRVEQPRGFGFQLGDQLERRVSLRLRHPYQLVLESLPSPGRLNRWIAFHSYEVETDTTAGSDFHEITLRYQVVNVEPSVTDAGVPGHQLQVKNGDEVLTFLVPASRTTITPFGEAVSRELAADIAPAMLPAGRRDWMLYGAMLIVSSTAFSWLHFGWFQRKTANPFARAYRRLRQYEHDPLPDEEYSRALRSLHEAFNLTAGHTLFPEQLAEFFTNHPRFARIEREILGYFARSNAYFFAGSPERLSLDELIVFARRCRDIEQELS